MEVVYSLPTVQTKPGEGFNDITLILPHTILTYTASNTRGYPICYFTLATVAVFLWGRLGSMSTAVLTDYIIVGCWHDSTLYYMSCDYCIIHCNG